MISPPFIVSAYKHARIAELCIHSEIVRCRAVWTNAHCPCIILSHDLFEYFIGQFTVAQYCDLHRSFLLGLSRFIVRFFLVFHHALLDGNQTNLGGTIFQEKRTGWSKDPFIITHNPQQSQCYQLILAEPVVPAEIGEIITQPWSIPKPCKTKPEGGSVRVSS